MMKLKFVISQESIENEDLLLAFVDCSGMVCDQHLRKMYPEFYCEYKRDCLYLKIDCDKVKIYTMFDGRTIFAMPICLHYSTGIDLCILEKTSKDLKIKCKDLFPDKISVFADSDWISTDDKIILKQKLIKLD